MWNVLEVVRTKRLSIHTQYGGIEIFRYNDEERFVAAAEIKTNLSLLLIYLSNLAICFSFEMSH